MYLRMAMVKIMHRWMNVEMAKTMKARCILLLVSRLRLRVRMKRGAARNHR